MAIKQILAVLQITNEEIRLLVGEYYNARVHVLARNTVPVKGLDGISIKNPDEVIKGIQKSIELANKDLGVNIERVLLIIPSYRSSKEVIQISKEINNEDGKVTLSDIQDVVREGLHHNVADDKVIVSWNVKKFYTNKIAYSYAPVGEKCSLLEMEMELYCSDKLTTYDYAKLLDKTGIGTIDVILDSYADTVETNLTGICPEGNMILLSIDASHSNLVLVHNGAINAIKAFNSGYGKWLNELSKTYHLSYNNISKIVFHHGNLQVDKDDDSPIYIWNDNGKTLQMSNKQLVNNLLPSIDEYCDEINYSCHELFKLKDISLKITGKGCEIDGLSGYLNQKLGVKCDTYYPDVIGARDPEWTTLFGAIYSFINIYPLYRNKKMSVDQEQFQQAVMKKKRETEKESGFKDKFKAFISIDKGEES